MIESLKPKLILILLFTYLSLIVGERKARWSKIIFSKRGLKSSKNRKCNPGYFNVRVEIQTDEYPGQTKWKIKNMITKEVVKKGGPYGKSGKYSYHEHSYCISSGLYAFKMKDLKSNGMRSGTQTGWYKITVNNRVVVEGDGDYDYQTSSKFGICMSDSHCNDSKACSIDSCDMSTNTCRFKKLTCQECGGMEVKVDVKTDQNPESIMWNIAELDSGKLATKIDKRSLKKKETLYEYTHCLLKSKVSSYKFTFYHADTISPPGYYKLQVNGNVLTDLTGPVNTVAQETIICMLDSDCNDDNECTVDFCNIEKNTCHNDPHVEFTKTCRSFGSPTVLVLRVDALDCQTSIAKRDLSDSIFGLDGGNDFTLKSQLSLCSMERFTLLPFTGYSASGNYVENGVGNVRIQTNVTNLPTGTVVTSVLEAATEKFGNLQQVADFVLVCLPYGSLIGSSKDWKGYAIVNSYLSVYNNEACTYPSVLMHELGHNLALSHSNDEVHYGDESGMMGLSYDRTQRPMKCYNAPKSWQLGWYYDSFLEINAKELKSRVFFLVGMANYKARGNAITVLRIVGSSDGFDYYVSFNHMIGMNSQTGEGENQILVHKRNLGYFYQDSILVAKLHEDRLFNVLNYDKQRSLLIKFIRFFDDADPPYATVLVEKFSYPCARDNQCNDFNACTVDICEESVDDSGNSCRYKESPCEDCGAITSVSVTTNSFPEHIAWTIQDYDEKVIFLVSGYYSDTYETLEKSRCLPYGSYLFTFQVSRNSTEEDLLRYEVRVGNAHVDGDETFQTSHIETYFTICSTDADCIDYDGCTVDYCNATTRLCQNIREESDENCLDCEWTTLNITFDNYLEETSWGIYTRFSDSLVVSGDPYPFGSMGLGRRKAPTKTARASGSLTNSKNQERRRLIDSEDEGIYESVCLERKVPYYFLIEDSFGDGICCSEGEGSYSLQINGEIVKTGGNFTSSETFRFRLSGCNADATCDDNDECTVDECLTHLGTCVYNSLPCSDCGKTVTVTVNTDGYPLETTWLIKRDSSGKLMNGGPFDASYASYETSGCLSYGTYTFAIYDSNNNGFICDSCGYSVTTDGGSTVIAEGDGSFFKKVSYDFVIERP